MARGRRRPRPEPTQRRPSGDRGSAVVGLAIALAVTVVALSAVAGGAALAGRQRVIDAADAGALAAADALSGAVPGDPCALAARVVRAGGAELAGCASDGLIATVTARASVLGIGVSATARAGPPPSDPDADPGAGPTAGG